MKLNNKWSKQIKNPDWLEADQLALYKCSRGVSPGTTWFKSSWWSERDLNSGSSDFKFQLWVDITVRLSFKQNQEMILASHPHIGKPRQWALAKEECDLRQEQAKRSIVSKMTIPETTNAISSHPSSARAECTSRNHHRHGWGGSISSSRRIWWKAVGADHTALRNHCQTFQKP